MTSERLFNSFIHPQKLLYPPNKFLATPLTKTAMLTVMFDINSSSRRQEYSNTQNFWVLNVAVHAHYVRTVDNYTIEQRFQASANRSGSL